MKYQLESMNVSMVSVSRRAGPPQRGQSALTNRSWRDRGGAPGGVAPAASRRGARAGDQPVADAVGDGVSAPAVRLDITRDGLLAVLVRHTVEPAGVDHRARVAAGLLPPGAVPVRRRDER